MKQLAIDVNRLAITILDENKVVPLAKIATPPFIDTRRAAVAATGGVPVNISVTPRDMCLGIAFTA